MTRFGVGGSGGGSGGGASMRVAAAPPIDERQKLRYWRLNIFKSGAVFWPRNRCDERKFFFFSDFLFCCICARLRSLDVAAAWLLAVLLFGACRISGLVDG